MQSYVRSFYPGLERERIEVGIRILTGLQSLVAVVEEEPGSCKHSKGQAVF
jgi:hypothetical protein